MKQAGHLHPLTWTTRRLVEIFSAMDFSIATGPEIELASYNFDRLNVPKNHPAREMQDTLWIDQPDSGPDARLMRTQTSPVQIRAMERTKPPVRLIVPGRAYRNEATDATHAIDFFQLEGLVIDQSITMANLLATLEQFAKAFFGETTEVRFRPSFFPFTEPSLEMSVFFQGRWLELAGAGMVHPNVLREMGIDPVGWSGFAFGMGIDRLTMIRFGVTDIRLLYSGDYRLLKQLESEPIA